MIHKHTFIHMLLLFTEHNTLNIRSHDDVFMQVYIYNRIRIRTGLLLTKIYICRNTIVYRI